MCYVEVRLAPQLHTGPDLDTAGVLAAVDRGLDRVRKEHEATDGVKSGAQPPFRYGIIACALRMFGPGHSRYYRGLYAALQGFTQPEVHAAASLSLARAVVEARTASDCRSWLSIWLAPKPAIRLRSIATPTCSRSRTS